MLQAAARRFYGADSHVKYTLLKRLLQGMHDTNETSTAPALSLDEAAAVCHVPASALLAMLRSNTCFRVKQSAGGHSIGLHEAALLEKGRQSTKAGILVEELPEPVDWVDNVNPVRPGASLTCWRAHACMHARVHAWQHCCRAQSAGMRMCRSDRQTFLA